MARKSTVAELLDTHRRQDEAYEASKSPLQDEIALQIPSVSDAPCPSSTLSTNDARAQDVGGSELSRLSSQHDHDAKNRMERVYDEVLRRKTTTTYSPVISNSSVLSLTPKGPLLRATHETEALRCTQSTRTKTSVQVNDSQRLNRKEQHSYHYLSPRSKDRRRRPWEDSGKRVAFVSPPLALLSSSSSAGKQHKEIQNTLEYRRNNEYDGCRERRQQRYNRRLKRREKARHFSNRGYDTEATVLNVDDATVQYIDAVLLKPDPLVFNKYTRFFLDATLETLYQDFTAIYWFKRARWHVSMWITLHVLIHLAYFVLLSSSGTKMEQFILSYRSLPTLFQWIYLFIALPFAVLSNQWNPFQTRWRSWVCFLIIVFNLSFQLWLANATRFATNAYVTVVREYTTCDRMNPNLLSTFAGFHVGSNIQNATITQALGILQTEQINVATRVTLECFDGVTQILVSFASLVSFLFVISIRLEFVQVGVVTCTGATTYAIVVSAFGLQLQWLLTYTYGIAIILILILSYSSDRTNRRSFLSNFLVEKENENLKTSLQQAEAALQNDTAHVEEEQAVARILSIPAMHYLEKVHIPLNDLTFLQAIGRGSMGDVIKARYFGTIVVCKRMRREHIVASKNGRHRHGSNTFILPDDSALASFRDEITLMSCLRHPNIVQFIGASWDNASNLCIVMEYLENGDMHSCLHSSIGKRFTWADPLLQMAIDVVQGMLYLHSQERPVVHRDLKSVNILCSATFGCKVGDFGLSRRYQKGIDALTTLVGTPFWLAPEIIRSERYGPEADVYSFGIVLTELETRETPYYDLEETGLKVLMRVAHKGLRPSVPSSCLPARRKLIQDCLCDIPKHRPTFLQVLCRLQGPVRLEIEGFAALQPELGHREQA
ncbi:hypothetical protein CCR75_003700 [Bremia lactucae]|uniref:Protein kinase domain-containing protein n=1 Tax=Bremia lactucae TaxID=4779 RepID=A0A976IJS6_BRELC|nr:hypothetical protein CCR75_003700 [Bremia lactucae]